MKHVWLLIVFLYTSFYIFAQPKRDYYFDQLTIANGLSQNYITCIHQDAQGFIWIGTKNGLNKYDGYQIKEYNHSSSEPNSLIDNNISSIFRDSHQQLWIGTHNGLCYYRPQTDDFEEIDLYKISNNRPENMHILSLYEDQDHNLWIGTEGGSLYLYHLKEKKIELFSCSMEQAPIQALSSYRDSLIMGCSNKQGIMHLDLKTRQVLRTSSDSLYNHASVTSFLKTNNEELWIGSYNKGLIKYGAKKSILTTFPIQGLCLTSDSLIIIGTENNGLFEYNKQKTISINTNQKENNLNSDAITCLYADYNGNIWIGTTNGGVNKYDPNRNNFKYISLHTEESSRQSIHSVLTIGKIDNDRLFIGLDNKGLYIYNKVTKKLIPHDISKYFPELKEIPINTALHDSRGFTWIGTYCKSMKVIGPKAEMNHINQIIAQEFPADSSVKHIYEDSQKRIWIATSHGEVFCYHPNSKTINKYYKEFNDLINPNVILSLYEDNKHQIWVGSLCGLYCFDEKKQDFRLAFLPNKENLHTSMNMIIPICQVKDALWLGTQDGLVEYYNKTKKANFFNINNGLPSNKIKGLLYNQKNNCLWISTDKGLSKLDLDIKEFSNFGLEDGIINREFNNMSYMCDQNGEFFFGSVNGIYHFFPEQIKVNSNIPKVVITSYQLYNNIPKKEGVKELYNIPITKTNEIYIPYSESTFSINYVALNYTNTKKNEYAYRLNNYDDQWRYVGEQRMATFTNLDPGTYFFQVKASNNNGIWNKEGSSLKIIILPPWYRTIWAYLIYALTGISFLLLLMRFYTNRVKIKSQLKNEQFERKQLENLNQLKMQFFSNITHEFRTPLTLILSPLNSMINQTVGKNVQRDYLKIIQNNAIKLLELVNELLDFSKSEAGHFSFKPVIADLNEIIKQEAQTFMPLAESKQINIQYIYEEESLECIADIVIIKKIVTNLLSNAIKYTPEGGHINIYLKKISHETPKIQICIEDSGKGIPQDQQKLIFERFYQMKEDNSNGTGIGLALVKKLIELHHGTIRVESNINTGSKFIAEIPFIEANQAVEKKVEKPVKEEITSKIISNIEREENNSHDSIEKIKSPTILIAEDNKELRYYISSLLINSYNVLTAENGKIALEIAKKELPNLILSDILMPELDGKEFCQLIKHDIHTCHIPFIMITALVSDSCQKEGLTMGADDYITKPFNPEILLSKISTILQSRALITRQAKALHALQPEEVPFTDKDSKFLLDLIEIIKQNLSNSELKIDDLGKELGMSHTPFYKKIKQLTNQTPNDFLKSIRLEQAKKLLTDSNCNISEIAYLTGFNSPKYFRECFKKQYGESPADFLEHRSKT